MKKYHHSRGLSVRMHCLADDHVILHDRDGCHHFQSIDSAVDCMQRHAFPYVILTGHCNEANFNTLCHQLKLLYGLVKFKLDNFSVSHDRDKPDPSPAFFEAMIKDGLVRAYFFSGTVQKIRIKVANICNKLFYKLADPVFPYDKKATHDETGYARDFHFDTIQQYLCCLVHRMYEAQLVIGVNQLPLSAVDTIGGFLQLPSIAAIISRDGFQGLVDVLEKHVNHAGYSMVPLERADSVCGEEHKQNMLECDEVVAGLNVPKCRSILDQSWLRGALSTKDFHRICQHVGQATSSDRSYLMVCEVIIKMSQLFQKVPFDDNILSEKALWSGCGSYLLNVCRHINGSALDANEVILLVKQHASATTYLLGIESKHKNKEQWDSVVRALYGVLADPVVSTTVSMDDDVLAVFALLDSLLSTPVLSTHDAIANQDYSLVFLDVFLHVLYDACRHSAQPFSKAFWRDYSILSKWQKVSDRYALALECRLSRALIDQDQYKSQLIGLYDAMRHRQSDLASGRHDVVSHMKSPLAVHSMLSMTGLYDGLVCRVIAIIHAALRLNHRKISRLTQAQDKHREKIAALHKAWVKHVDCLGVHVQFAQPLYITHTDSINSLHDKFARALERGEDNFTWCFDAYVYCLQRMPMRMVLGQLPVHLDAFPDASDPLFLLCFLGYIKLCQDHLVFAEHLAGVLKHFRRAYSGQASNSDNAWVLASSVLMGYINMLLYHQQKDTRPYHPMVVALVKNLVGQKRPHTCRYGTPVHVFVDRWDEVCDGLRLMFAYDYIDPNLKLQIAIEIFPVLLRMPSVVEAVGFALSMLFDDESLGEPHLKRSMASIVMPMLADLPSVMVSPEYAVPVKLSLFDLYSECRWYLDEDLTAELHVDYAVSHLYYLIIKNERIELLDYHEMVTILQSLANLMRDAVIKKQNIRQVDSVLGELLARLNDPQSDASDFTLLVPFILAFLGQSIDNNMVDLLPTTKSALLGCAEKCFVSAGSDDGIEEEGIEEGCFSDAMVWCKLQVLAKWFVLCDVIGDLAEVLLVHEATEAVSLELLLHQVMWSMLEHASDGIFEHCDVLYDCAIELRKSRQYFHAELRASFVDAASVTVDGVLPPDYVFDAWCVYLERPLIKKAIAVAQQAKGNGLSQGFGSSRLESYAREFHLIFPFERSRQLTPVVVDDDRSSAQSQVSRTPSPSGYFLHPRLQAASPGTLFSYASPGARGLSVPTPIGDRGQGMIALPNHNDEQLHKLSPC